MQETRKRTAIYLNNATTSYPKSQDVITRITESLNALPGDAKRGHCNGTDMLAECRMNLAQLVHSNDNRRIILTPGTTHSLNLAIQGSVKGFKRPANIVTTVYEHNSVLRPLEYMRKQGKISISYLDRNDALSPEGYRSRITEETRAVIVTACSNVTGDMPDLPGIAQVCADNDLVLIIDSAQAAGSIEIDVTRLSRKTIIAFAGHKGLMGPQGTGALYIGEDIRLEDLSPLIRGGTGTKSDQLHQPEEWPMYYESGTMNIPGFAGLSSALEFVLTTVPQQIGEHKAKLISLLLDNLSDFSGVEIATAMDGNLAGGVISMHFEDNISAIEIGDELNKKYAIITRSGLHCAPLIHRELGWTDGSLRLSVGWFNTEDDIVKVSEALRAILKRQSMHVI